MRITKSIIRATPEPGETECRHINAMYVGEDRNSQRSETMISGVRKAPKVEKESQSQIENPGKRPHIKATARDAIAVSIVLDWLKGSAFGNVNSWLMGRP